MGLSREYCTAPQKLCSWDPLRKPWRKKSQLGVRSWAHGITRAIIPCYCLQVCCCCCSKKKQLVLWDVVLSLSWPKSSNTHSPRGVHVRVCGPGCCLFEVEGSTERAGNTFWKVWGWMKKTNSSISGCNTFPFYSGRFSATNQSLAILTKFLIIKIACEWNKSSTHILITCTFFSSKSNKTHLRVFP